MLIQRDDFTVIAGMANGLISMQHRQTPAEARALHPIQSRKDKQKVTIEHPYILTITFLSLK